MKTILTLFTRHVGPARKLLRIVSASLFIFSLGQQAHAQFPRVESFKNSTAPGFNLFGTATLTGTGTTGGNGYLRLTNAITNQAGTAIDQSSFPAPQGFSISFEFFSYGKTTAAGADGFSVYLIDGATTNFRIGADGGSLGYAQRIRDAANAPGVITPGVSNGYVGIGIDEYGNYSNASEGRSGGLVASGITPNTITIRGKGNGTASTEYPYLASSGQLPFALDVATAQAQETSGDYRRAFIDFIPFINTSGVIAYRITVRIQHGSTVTTTLNNIELPPPPPTLRIGFSGSTGLSNNVHEIRNLAIVRPTIANNDRFGTRYGIAASYDVTANDEAPGSSLDKATVDLNPTTSTIERTLTVAGKGTFEVNAEGIITFTPVNTFAGVVTIPYVIRDILGTLSNQATITVDVSGADLASSVSGPTSANPGSRVTYVVSTTNSGLETADNVVPTLRLPSTVTNISIPADATIATVGGEQVITFAQVSSLAANAPAVVNSVTFTTPANGSVLGTVNSTSSIPDPALTNNSASITTNIVGTSTVAANCATPGKDGVGALTSASAPNTYYPGVTVGTANGVSTVTLGAALTGANAGTTPLSAGDLVVIMQMQGADITTGTTTATYGTPSNSTAGQYDYATVTSVSGNVITLNKLLTKSYTTTTGDQQRRFQVVRVPQYSALTVSGTVTGAAWNGQAGGVLVLDVLGTTTFNSTGTLNMNGRGFRGGGGKNYTGDATRLNTDVRTLAAGAHAAKGEGIAGTPRYVYAGGTTTLTNDIEGYTNGSNAMGAPANAGGGATDLTPLTNSGNAGGAGGGNARAGGLGGFGHNGVVIAGSGSQGQAGRSLGSGSNSVVINGGGTLMMGGGGGAGSTDDGAANEYLSSGGAGGGIIILRSGPISGTALLSANGANAPLAGTSVATNQRGGGGGGAGGTVVVTSVTTTGAASSLDNVTASVTGGNGSSVGFTDNGLTGNSRVSYGFGPGGGGSGGVVYANNDGLFTSINTTVTGGAAGQTRAGTGNNPATVTFGASAGGSGTDATTTVNGSAASTCLPTLTAALSTSTPTIVRSGSTVNPATYTLSISNTGGTAAGASATITLNNLFSFDNTVTPTLQMRYADGSQYTVPSSDYTLSTTAASAPVFSGLTISSGATLSISFRANVMSTAVNNVAYGASATVAYLDPTRNTTGTNTRVITPATNKAAGANSTYLALVAGNVPGANYAATTSTAEDVTIIRPLPVELKSFVVTAARVDAKLTWETASELNNDRFVVERSLDGLTFAPIGSVQGKGTSHKLATYSYNDAGIGRTQEVAYYRLKQLDFDGTATFSPVRAVKFVGGAIKTDVSVYPNPTQAGATLDLTGLPAGDYQVILLDLTGRTLSQLTLVGQREHALPVQALPQGSYIVRVRGNGVSVALPLVRN